LLIRLESPEMSEEYSQSENDDMDTLTNLRTFLQVAASGGFSAAARELKVATSVVTKRVDQLETLTGTRLFTRSTRQVMLTDDGQNWLGRVRALIADADDVLGAVDRNREVLNGPIRIKLPTTLGMMYLADVVAEFQQQHQQTTIEVILTDRGLNPVEEGFDIAIAAFGASYKDVIDVSLCPLNRTLCAAPVYLAASPPCQHPRDLQKHRTLCFQPTGIQWGFEGAEGPIQVDIQPRLSANEGQVLLSSAIAGNGIALLSEYLAKPALNAGLLVPVMPAYKPVDMWVKALVPVHRLHITRVSALLEFFKASFLPAPPWDRC
jgi:DNA-binding transcriptional LysR family regulator